MPKREQQEHCDQGCEAFRKEIVIDSNSLIAVHKAVNFGAAEVQAVLQVLKGSVWVFKEGSKLEVKRLRILLAHTLKEFFNVYVRIEPS